MNPAGFTFSDFFTFFSLCEASQKMSNVAGEADMPYARSRDGVRIYYEEYGQGTPLILAYGIGGNADLWDVNRDALAARHRLILWEPRGHYRSDSPEDPATYSFGHWVDDLRSVLDRL